MPDKRLASLHLTIEYAVTRTLRRFKDLQDKDIEWVYERYRDYFQAVWRGKVVAEPDSTRRDRSELMDYIWECLVKWEAAGGPDDLLDGSFSHGGRPVTTVEELYVIGFNDLRKSCRINRRAGGARGYVKAVQAFVSAILEDDPSLEELLDPTVPVMEMLVDFSGLLEKRGYQISLENSSSGVPAVDALVFDSDEELTADEYTSLLKQYPGNQLLRAEYASLLMGESRVKEAERIYRELLLEAPDNPFYLSAYVNTLFSYDVDKGFDEAERLEFQFDLSKYPHDTSEGYSLSVLLAHSSACIDMALQGRDMAFSLELFDDLVRTNLPRELLTGIGGLFLLAVSEHHERQETPETIAPLSYLREDFPEFSAAVSFLEWQWGVIVRG